MTFHESFFPGFSMTVGKYQGPCMLKQQKLRMRRFADMFSAHKQGCGSGPFSVEVEASTST